MSKKLEAVKKAVFYSNEKPEILAEIISGIITDTVTTVTLDGADSITIPATGNETATYTATTFSQYGDAMEETATITLKSAVTGVSISSGTVTVASTCTAESFTLVATSGSKSVEKVVELVSAS